MLDNSLGLNICIPNLSICETLSLLKYSLDTPENIEEREEIFDMKLAICRITLLTSHIPYLQCFISSSFSIIMNHFRVFIPVGQKANCVDRQIER